MFLQGTGRIKKKKKGIFHSIKHIKMSNFDAQDFQYVNL